MNSHFISALIVDSHEGEARQMSKTLKNVFSKIYLQSDLAKVLAECTKIRPEVVVINFTLAQRTANTKLLEQLSHLTPSPIFFGYMETHEPGVTAHALEVGFHDIFTRPFDADIISTKLNRFFAFDKSRDRDLGYVDLLPPVSCEIQCQLKLSAIDENGFHFKSGHYISKGTCLNIRHPLIREIFKQDELELMITNTSVENDWTEYMSFAEPKKATEETSAALRRFILSKVQAL